MTGRQRLAIILALFAAGLGVWLVLARVGASAGGPPAGQPAALAEPLPQRIIATAPSAIETLFALGAGGRVVGVGDFAVYPPEAKARPRVGGEFNPNFERLLTLEPDLIIAQGKAEALADFCQRHGIRILHTNMNALDTIRSGIRDLGRAVGREAEADRLVASLDLGLATVAWRVAGRPRPKVFLAMGHRAGSLTGLSTATGTSFLSQLVAFAGGDNLFADVQQWYPPVSKEALLQRAPDVILELHPGESLPESVQQQLIADWDAMPSLPAVRNRRIHVLTHDYLMIPGPRVARVAEVLAEVLHPEAGKKPNDQ